MQTSRRNFLATALGASLVSEACSRSGPPAEKPSTPEVTVENFRPNSMLVVPEHPVPRARYPVIDVHTHVSFVFREEARPEPDAVLQGTPTEQVAQTVRWMDEINLQTMVELTGGTGDTLRRNIAELQQKYPGRFLVCTEPSWDRIREPDYASWQADELGRAKEAGAKGLKILKTLGLYLREDGDSGPLVKVDDPRFDPMWEAAGKLGLPVFIHTSDPDAFFTPTDRHNELWVLLGSHPDWSFYDKDFPSKPELLAARNRVIERHPKTTFVGLHVANHPENLDDVSGWLDRYSNLHVEIGARLHSLGRQPRRARKFFEQYQDRILFGTDATPNATLLPQQDLKPGMFQCYFRFLETLDEYFDFGPGPNPPAGRWKIYGIGLPDEILKKVYHNNAARVLGLEPI